MASNYASTQRANRYPAGFENEESLVGFAKSWRRKQVPERIPE
jgi:hypothetical protein